MLTSVGDNERQRIVRKYYPEGDPGEIAWQLEFARKYGLKPSPYTVMTGKMYDIPSAYKYPTTIPVLYAAGKRVMPILLITVGILGLMYFFKRRKMRFESPSMENDYTELTHLLQKASGIITDIKETGSGSDMERLNNLLNFNMRKWGDCACETGQKKS
jgi:hypothetical protein